MRIPVQGPVPTYATAGSAGADLRAALSAPLTLDPERWAKLPTGVRVAIPEGHVGFVCSRSGLASRAGVVVLNAPGVIDSDYRGEVGVLLVNHGVWPHVIHPGDKIAQLAIVPVARAEFVEAELSETERGGGGFGSTGT